MQNNLKNLYNNLCIEYNFINTSRNKKVFMIISSILLLIITIKAITSKNFVLPIPFILFFFLILELLIIYIGSQHTGNQNELYREKVLAPILQRKIIGLKYKMYEGMSKEIYDLIGFPSGNIYKAKENIKIPFKSGYIDISNISIKQTYKFENSEHIFEGYISEFDIPKSISKKVEIIYNAFNLIEYQHIVPIDNSRFNEKYNLICEDKIYALRMFTSESFLELMDLYNKYKIIINLHIKESKVYIQSRKEVGINDIISFKYTDVEDKIKALEFIYKTSELIFNVIEKFEGENENGKS